MLFNLQQHRTSKKSKSAHFKFGTAEKKLLVVFLYFELLVIIALITFSLNTRYENEFIQSLLDLFSCEQTGHDPENICSRSDINRLGFPSATLLSYIILGFFPVVILVYAVNVKELKKALKVYKYKLYSSTRA